MIGTSYFGNLKRITHPLSISAKAPNWYTGPQFKILAPTYEILSAYKAGNINEIEYTTMFYDKVLASLDAQEIYEKIISLYSNDVSLLCYEKPDDFCHRHLVATWLNSKLCINIKERDNFVKSSKLVW